MVTWLRKRIFQWCKEEGCQKKRQRSWYWIESRRDWFHLLESPFIYHACYYSSFHVPFFLRPCLVSYSLAALSYHQHRSTSSILFGVFLEIIHVNAPSKSRQSIRNFTLSYSGGRNSSRWRGISTKSSFYMWNSMPFAKFIDIDKNNISEPTL